MNNELATISTSMDMWEDETKLQEIKKIFAPKLNTMEFQAFIGLGKATSLNPFLRELWAVKYAENSPAQIFIGRDGYRKTAQRHPNYDYHQSDAVYTNDTFEVVNGEVKHSYKLANRGDLIGGYCVVKRRSSSKPIYVYVNLKDYNKKQSCWNSLQATMIAKVAEAQCLRMAFQEQFAGSLSEYEENIVIEGQWEPKLSQEEQMQSLLAKKGLTDAINNHGTSKTNNDNSNADSVAYNTGLCNANSSPSPQASPNVVRPGMDDNGESKVTFIDTQNVVAKCSEEQLESIDLLMHSKEFKPERMHKALKHFGVKTFAELTEEQATQMIKILERAE